MHQQAGLWQRRLQIAGRQALIAASGGPGSLRSGPSADTTDLTYDSVTTRYAVIFDTHVTPENESYVATARRVLDHLAARDPAPDFILHVGDVTSTGFPEKWALYDCLIPEALRDRLHHVPGNHEVRWDADGNREFLRRFPAAPFGFDSGDLLVIGLDGTQLLQEIANIGQPQLDWLAKELARVGPERPVVLFNHFPIGDLNYFVIDQDALYEVIASSNIVAIHAGHIHRDTIVTQNGFTQVSGTASRDAASFHWVEVSGDLITISRGAVDVAGRETLTHYVDVPLIRDSAFAAGPPPTTLNVKSGDAMDVAVDVPAAPAAANVDVRFWPSHIYANKDADRSGWHDLEPGNGEWHGVLPCTGIPPGVHRVEIRVHLDAGRMWQYARDVVVPGGAGDMERLWTLSLGAPVQAGVVTLPGTIQYPATAVVASATGSVHGIEPGDREPRIAWSVERGSAVIGTPGVSSDGTVFVGSLEHGVTAINGYTGDRNWTWLYEGAVLGSVCVASSADRGMLLVPTGTTLYALDPGSGAMRWKAEVGGFVGGRPASDATRVFCEPGDGTVRALDLISGSPLWQTTIFEDPTRHRRFLYSGWSHFTTVIEEGAGTSIVIAATVEATFAIDGSTGNILWSQPLGTMYAPPLVIDRPARALILVSERGRLCSVAPHTGESDWEIDLGYRVMNSAPVQRSGYVHVPGTGGQMTAVDVATGSVVARYQVGPTGLLSTPAFLGSTLIVAGTDGVVRGIGTGEIGLEEDWTG